MISKASHQPSFIWIREGTVGRNRFVSFERTFVPASLPGSFPLHLFADTRYRLWVNGGFVAAGPGRFVTHEPEYDSHELAGMLKPGENSIRVEVNFFGASSYQSMPDGRPGFIAWGGGGGVTLETPGGWIARRMDAWRPDSPTFSFAQGPVEICDTRPADAGVVATEVLRGSRAPWGKLKPYSGAEIPFAPHRPKMIELAGRIANDRQVLGIMAHDPEFLARRAQGAPNRWSAFATWIHSPRAQTVEVGCFWSDLLCNGAGVAVDTSTPFGNHGRTSLDLREGWNLFCGKFEILTEFWAYCIGIPKAAGLGLHGRRDRGFLPPLAVAPVAVREEICLPAPDDSAPPAGWTFEEGAPPNLTPARVMAWDAVADDAMRRVGAARLSEMSPIISEAATWCFSFEGEFLGHAVLDVEAPEGTVMDVATDDWLSPSGAVALYQSNPFADSADRFILRGGAQRVELFHPRGGKFLQVTLRAPGSAAPLSLHDVFIRSRQSAGPDRTRFACDNDVLNWVWPTAMRTLACSTDEAYGDCPWRERGSYIGDTLVNIHQNFLFNPDTRTARRTLRLFASAQLPDGQLACCAPAWLRQPHEDFTLVWILALRDYWAHTGDVTLVEEVWDAVGKIWASPSWDRHESGLWNATGKRLFIDWGVLASERGGDGNAVLNLFRLGAANACAELARAIGKHDRAAAHLADARCIEAALIGRLWNKSEGRFDAFIGSGSQALHANVLALHFGVGSDLMRSSILDSIEPSLLDNFGRAVGNDPFGGHLELYFFHYLLPALASGGRPYLAERLINQHYGLVKSLGFDTLPETLSQMRRGQGSRCHSWSGAAAIYAARYVLGIRPAEPGNPRRMVFAPVFHGITGASGRIAHPDGWIDVIWERTCDGGFWSSITAPPGVEVIEPRLHPCPT
jgi:hypothetical protein